MPVGRPPSGIKTDPSDAGSRAWDGMVALARTMTLQEAASATPWAQMVYDELLEKEQNAEPLRDGDFSGINLPGTRGGG